MGMTDDEFAKRMGISTARINEIAHELNARADPYNAQFVVREEKTQGRGVILKIPQKGNVFFSLYTYADSDLRPGLRGYLSDQRILGEQDGFACKNATDKANTSNGTVCDFILQNPITATEVNANLQTLISIKSKILKMLDDANVFTVHIDAESVGEPLRHEIQSKGVDMKEKIKALLTNVGQVILHGAPGTGKTYTAMQIAAELTGDDLKSEKQEHIKKVQFHAGYDYSDFVLGLKPKLVGSDGQQTVSFEWKAGVFKEFVDKAKVARDAAMASASTIPKFVFVIDEINRADLSRVFGELFSLIEMDYRYPRNKIGVALPNGENLVIPDNLYIIGTMNDIDRSVESMDFALRRRFAWQEIDAESSKTILDAKVKDSSDCAKLKRTMDAVNTIIGKADESGLGTDYQIGGAIFANFTTCFDGADPYESLWSIYLETIIKEYLRGNRKNLEIIRAIKTAYDAVVEGA